MLKSSLDTTIIECETHYQYCTKMLLSIVVLLVTGFVSQAKSQEQCFYQYVRQPDASSSELNCNIIGAQVRIDCAVSGQINSQFSIVWHFSKSFVDSPFLLSQVLTNSSTYTINENVLNSSSLIILSRLTINGLDENSVGSYWCSVDSPRDATVNPSRIVTITAPCTVEQLPTCTREVQLFRITAGSRCADQQFPTISIVQGGNVESQCNSVVTTSPPVATTKKQDIITTTTISPATTISTTKGETSTELSTEIVHTLKTDSTTLQSVTVSTEIESDQTNTASGATTDNIKSDDILVPTSIPPTGDNKPSQPASNDHNTGQSPQPPVVDTSSSFPMSIVWIIIGVVFIILLGAIFILLALVVCLQCRKNRIKGSGSPTHNPNAYTSGVRVEEIEANERFSMLRNMYLQCDTCQFNSPKNSNRPGPQGASTIITNDAEYEEISTNTNFIQVTGSDVTNYGGFESDTSPKTPREHSMQHALPAIQKYEDVTNLTSPGEVPPAVKKHKYETIVTEEVPEYSHLQHSTNSRPTSRANVRRESNTSGVLTMSTTSSKAPLCGKLSVSSGTVHILTEALFDNSDYAMSSVSSSTDQHVNIYRSESPEDAVSEDTRQDDEEYSRLNIEMDDRKPSTERRDPRYEKIPVGRVHSLPLSQKRDYDSLERNHHPPLPGYEPINIQTSRLAQNRRNYSSLERNQAPPGYEPVEFKATVHPGSKPHQNYSSLKRDVTPPGYETVEFTRTSVVSNQRQNNNNSSPEHHTVLPQPPPGYESVAPKGRHSYSSIDPKHRKVHATYSLPIVSTQQKYVSENGHLYHVLENANQQQQQKGPEQQQVRENSRPMYHVLDDAIANMERTIASLDDRGSEVKKNEAIPIYSVVDKVKKRDERSRKGQSWDEQKRGGGMETD